MALTTEPVTRVLPIADMASVRRHARGLLREHRSTMTTVIGLHALAALAALVAPRLVGELVDGVTNGTTRSHIDTLAIWLGASVLLQTVLMWAARRASFIMGEGVFAQPVVFPTVAIDKSRLRTIVTAAHADEQLDLALAAFDRVGHELGLISG